MSFLFIVSDLELSMVPRNLRCVQVTKVTRSKQYYIMGTPAPELLITCGDHRGPLGNRGETSREIKRPSNQILVLMSFFKTQSQTSYMHLKDVI